MTPDLYHLQKFREFVASIHFRYWVNSSRSKRDRRLRAAARELARLEADFLAQGAGQRSTAGRK